MSNHPMPRAKGQKDCNKLARRSEKNYNNNFNLTHFQSVKNAKLRKENNATAENRKRLGSKQDKMMKRKTNITIGTLNQQGSGGNPNAGTLGGKLDEVTRLMDNLEVDVMGLQETKRPLNDVVKLNGYTFVFASSLEAGKKKESDNNFQFKHNKGTKIK